MCAVWHQCTCVIVFTCMHFTCMHFTCTQYLEQGFWKYTSTLSNQPYWLSAQWKVYWPETLILFHLPQGSSSSRTSCSSTSCFKFRLPISEICSLGFPTPRVKVMLLLISKTIKPNSSVTQQRKEIENKLKAIKLTKMESVAEIINILNNYFSIYEL